MTTQIARAPSGSKSYGEGAAEVHALRDATLSRRPAGELVAIMGPSGSGKSTLLTIAGSLEVADERRGAASPGRAIGEHVAPTTGPGLRRRSIGYVFQDFNLLAGPHCAARTSRCRSSSTASAPGSHRCTPPHERWRTLGVADLGDRFPDDLSGGERQRVAIARAVVGERQLLLADEPTGALDSVNGEAVMRLLRAACQRGVAGVVVTHDAQLAAGRIAWCSCGTGASSTRPFPRPVPSSCSSPARVREHGGPPRRGRLVLAPLPARMAPTGPRAPPPHHHRHGGDLRHARRLAASSPTATASSVRLPTCSSWPPAVLMTSRPPKPPSGLGSAPSTSSGHVR